MISTENLSNRGIIAPVNYRLSTAQWLELLKQIGPGVRRAAIIRDPAITAGIGQWGAIQGAGPMAKQRSKPFRD
jgi:hypothetical protein